MFVQTRDPWSGRMLSFQPINVDTGMEDEFGLLVFREGKLLAVAVRLESSSHADMCGQWNIEAVFDGRRLPRQTFDTVDDMTVWLSNDVGPWLSDIVTAGPACMRQAHAEI